MNFIESTGIRYAQELIMIGKAIAGFMPIKDASVIGSTLIALIKRTASATTGHVQDTFKVAGITRSLTWLNPSNRAVAGQYPMYQKS